MDIIYKKEVLFKELNRIYEYNIKREEFWRENFIKEEFIGLFKIAIDIFSKGKVKYRNVVEVLKRKMVEDENYLLIKVGILPLSLLQVKTLINFYKEKVKNEIWYKFYEDSGYSDFVLVNLLLIPFFDFRIASLLYLNRYNFIVGFLSPYREKYSDSLFLIKFPKIVSLFSFLCSFGILKDMLMKFVEGVNNNDKIFLNEKKGFEAFYYLSIEGVLKNKLLRKGKDLMNKLMEYYNIKFKGGIENGE